jgi:hypothetical protein
LSFGGIGGFLVIKLVKPTKLFCSWPPNHGGVCQVRFTETKPYVRTAAAGILREANTTVGEELGRFDTSDRVRD